MAVNEWIEGYLEAILATGVIEDRPPSAPEAEVVGFNTRKYFIEEVVSGVDESGLHQAWLKATATKDSRLRRENLCWRIWHLSRTKKQVELTADGTVPTPIEKPKGLEDTVLDDLGDDLGDDNAQPSSEETAGSECNVQPESETQHEDEEKGRYIVMISLHGLVRGENMELGRDSDTGGQVRYVVEFARALASMPKVYRVDLLTRQISSAEVDWSYAEPTEMIAASSYDCSGGEVGESSGAYIVRIPCGPTDQYLRKELLWPHIEEFVDRALAHITNMAKVLGEQIAGGEPVWPYVVHGHYADAGNVAALISGALNVPMVFTGHSLGRNKLQQLLKQGRQSNDINEKYNIMRRIEAEEFALDTAELVITSTRQEIEEQWGLYDGFDVKLEKTLRIRTKRGVNYHGRHMPCMAVIPPGVDFTQEVAEALDADADPSGLPRSTPPIWNEVKKFLNNPHKPMILALARPDPKKNLTTLINAFGKSRALKELANLTLIMGNRDDIETMSTESSKILTTVLKLIDKYDLYGLVAYPKHHKLSEVPDIYGLAAQTKGVFVNPALVEPFGLTLIEAAARGLPIVATKNGGPVDIQKTLHNGVLVDPHDEDAISDALLKLLTDRAMWAEYQKNGLKNVHLYSWPEHCKKYLSLVAACTKRRPGWQTRSNTLEDESTLKGVSPLQLSDDSIIGNSTLADRSKEDLLRSSQLRHQHLASNRCPAFKKQLIVIAVDSYIGSKYTMVGAVREMILNANKGGEQSQSLVLSTALTELEVLEMLSDFGICATKFDAFICRSGAALYYPCKASPSASSQTQLVQDYEYESGIDYNWSYDDIRKAMARILSSEGTAVEAVEDIKGSSRYCISYDVASVKMHTVDEYRRLLRTRGFRCHGIVCRNSTKLYLVPVLTSRSQALRYLSLRWEVDLASATVFVGESGDSDYDQLRSGVHNTEVLQGVGQGQTSNGGLAAAEKS